MTRKRQPRAGGRGRKVLPFDRKKATKKKQRGKKGRGGDASGRPPTEITEAQWRVVERMAADMCTHDEIADYLGISKRTLYAPHIRPRFDQITKMKAAATRWNVRKRQLKSALGGAVVPSIWWGKQHLGQKDKQEHTGSGATAFDQVAGAEERLLQLLEKLAKNKEQS